MLDEVLQDFGEFTEEQIFPMASCDHVEDCDCKPVLAVVVYDPDNFYIADQIANATNGERQGYGPGQPAEFFI